MSASNPLQHARGQPPPLALHAHPAALEARPRSLESPRRSHRARADPNPRWPQTPAPYRNHGPTARATPLSVFPVWAHSPRGPTTPALPAPDRRFAGTRTRHPSADRPGSPTGRVETVGRSAPLLSRCFQRTRVPCAQRPIDGSRSRRDGTQGVRTARREGAGGRAAGRPGVGGMVAEARRGSGSGDRPRRQTGHRPQKQTGQPSRQTNRPVHLTSSVHCALLIVSMEGEGMS